MSLCQLAIVELALLVVLTIVVLVVGLRSNGCSCCFRGEMVDGVVERSMAVEAGGQL